jgi:hypothetical protein
VNRGAHTRTSVAEVQLREKSCGYEINGSNSETKRLVVLVRSTNGGLVARRVAGVAGGCRVCAPSSGSSPVSPTGDCGGRLGRLTLALNAVQTLGHVVTLYLTVGEAFDHGSFWWIFGPIYDTAFRAGLAVLSGWLTLALTGTWRASSGWLDRSGHFLG